ncbi:hypothetical protein GCM10027589_30780 [Actinocorallia lasiicapitis]
MLLRSAIVVLSTLLLTLLTAGSARPEPAPAPVRGYLDAHSHLMSADGFGGRAFCGRTFHPAGIEQALKDCDDHGSDGAWAWFENLTSDGTPFGAHETTGYPTFKDWPAHNSLTHNQTYYEWLERSWRAGQRILVNQLVTNRILCEVYPLKKDPCEEMTAIRVQAKRTYELQDYIDQKSGGPGKGWFRVARTPAEARSIIGQGKLAVVLGIETSELFGCRGSAILPGCTRAQIDKGLDEVKALGVSSLFLCHKFDNALCGVRFDGGAIGAVLNMGNILSSGHNWQAQTCKGAAHDNTIPSVFLKAPHCNLNGLTPLGAYTVQGMMKRGMIVEVDHMSVKAADETLAILERGGYSGVISGHSWTDNSYLSRIYRLGGMVTAYASPADSFTAGWKHDKALRDPRFAYGYGYGLDANGLGPLPGPRPGSQVAYPFTSPFDPSVTLGKAHTGTRFWDFNTEGVAHYGLVPDWTKDLQAVGGPELIDDLANGAEAYLQMWQRAVSYQPPA